ncbi:MAG: hypothetical protein KatS3mg105_1458 [Gemmatales bacterium]|nr:MAG: hypothetical protein KatS3mg105_1458 [Gemmatales bacterium]
MNRYKPHICVVFEDDKCRQLAHGFVLNHRIDDRRMQVMPPAGGWSNVLEIFRKEYVPYLHRFPEGYVVLVIDFDGRVIDRQQEFAKAIPEKLKPRVFVIGLKDDPETFKRQIGLNLNFEQIGMQLADECLDATFNIRQHEQCDHNKPEFDRCWQSTKDFLVRGTMF